MSIQKSPGQKRKGIVRIVTIIIFIASTYGASLVFEAVSKNALKWVKSHQEITATVAELIQEEEQYRGRKGRKRYRDIYKISYSFSVGGNDYFNTVEVSSSEYSRYKKGNNIGVWYSDNNPEINDTKINIISNIENNNPASNLFGAVPYTGPICLFLYWLLQIIFVRESKKALPTGFYTETSWLDIDDNYVVALDNSDLVYFNINEKKAKSVQEAYQSDASLEELIQKSNSSNVKRVPLDGITELSSDHNSDVIYIKHNEKSHSIEFLNQTVKAHALDRIKKLIPESLDYDKKERSRIQAAIPATIFLAVLVAIGAYFNIFLLSVAIGFIGLVWVVPKIISRLIDPTVTEKWILAEAETVVE